MSTEAPATQASVEAIVERIFISRQISRSDQHLLMSILLSPESVSETDKRQIVNRVFDALHKGLIKVVD